MYSSDYHIRIHRSAGDSGQNEAERTNSAIGDDVVDGATINWERYLEFLKGDCSKTSSDGEQCKECKEREWISPTISHITRPDTSKLPMFHYKDVFDSCGNNNL